MFDGATRTSSFVPALRVHVKCPIPAYTLHTNTPIYPTTSGMQQNKLKKIIEGSLEFCDKHDLLKEESEKKDYSEYGNLLETLKFLHKPPVETDLNELIEGKHPAQQALIKEELIAVSYTHLTLPTKA